TALAAGAGGATVFAGWGGAGTLTGEGFSAAADFLAATAVAPALVDPVRIETMLTLMDDRGWGLSNRRVGEITKRAITTAWQIRESATGYTTEVCPSVIGA
ncbi:hypothetical protein, partial [Desulfosarcina cetonica]|uniref:hypothetical protein n=1 Tax=Desulfosarcina cetonica TaxID=90730 RepID=UPI00155D9E1A